MKRDAQDRRRACGATLAQAGLTCADLTDVAGDTSELAETFWPGGTSSDPADPASDTSAAIAIQPA